MEPVGTVDIAAMLGVSRQRTHQIIHSKSFPDPVATVNARTKMWDRAAVLAWADANRYGLIDPPPS